MTDKSPTALKRIRQAKKVIDEAAGEGLVEVVDSMDELVLFINTGRYEEDSERTLVLVPTRDPLKFKLMFQDGAGYEGLIGILHTGQRRVGASPSR
jgi:hypothetical protein